MQAWAAEPGGGAGWDGGSRPDGCAPASASILSGFLTRLQAYEMGPHRHRLSSRQGGRGSGEGGRSLWTHEKRKTLVVSLFAVSLLIPFLCSAPVRHTRCVACTDSGSETPRPIEHSTHLLLVRRAWGLRQGGRSQNDREARSKHPAARAALASERSPLCALFHTTTPCLSRPPLQPPTVVGDGLDGRGVRIQGLGGGGTGGSGRRAPPMRETDPQRNGALSCCPFPFRSRSRALPWYSLPSPSSRSGK